VTKSVNLRIYPDRARKVAERLVEALEGEGIFGRKDLPDDLIIDVIDRRNIEKSLLVVTLTTALDYMRNAEELWKSSAKTLSDGEVSWVFNPGSVVERGESELKEALLKHKLAKKKEKDTRIWRKISETLHRKYGGKVSNLFKEYGYDVRAMFEDITKNRKEEFPSLSGTKLFPHWIRSLKDKFNLPFKRLDELPIPVDVHVARATLTTGCVRGKYSSKGISEALRKRVIEVWKEALKDTSIAPIEMFRPLWLLSKHGCHYRKNGERPKIKECPVADFCVEGKVVVSSARVEIDT